MTDQPPQVPPDDFEERLASALGAAHEHRAADGKWEAIQNWNEWVARNGLRLEEFLQWIDRRGRDWE
jgi:hypothetical protein